MADETTLEPKDAPSPVSVAVSTAPPVKQVVPSTSPRVIWTVILSVATLATSGLFSLFLLAIWHIDNPIVITAIVSITSGASNALVAMLVSTKQTPAPQ